MEKPEKDKPYSVIIFSYENNEYVSVCPRNWLNEDKKTCLWAKNNFQSKAINFNIPPEAALLAALCSMCMACVSSARTELQHIMQEKTHLPTLGFMT
ncbi:hypothetical protein MSG28_003493 [Choristoneura fumiferana]|uniref:Uncharacterized protein n=1 Tax=Choristoneura fumiferana TaxID=7141 RepID=A0ACC0KFF6_CHOFU|nr:hypothetical protein MSG28_003493 [Choristoneura fumiferana]